tara:strand:- start:135 stop:593 length:459 start_codon:yes stop_codon:yes gene_type:complete
MKRSEFKAQIREEIIDILEQASAEDIKNQQDYNAELEKTAQLVKDAGLAEGNDSDKFQDDGYVQHKYDDSVIDKYNIPVAPTAVFQEDEEPKAGDLKGEPLSKIGYKLADTQKEMKKVAKKYSAAPEGSEKEKFLNRLRELNKIKKELEALL